jgi:hypothetical protein
MRGPRFTSISTAVLPPSLPELGKIKIGGKGELRRGSRGGTFQLPVKFDHFVITGRSRDDGGHFIPDPAIHGVLGDRPRQLAVRLLYDEPEDNFQYFFNAYDGKRMRCSGNGVEAFDRVLGQKIACTCPLLKAHEGPYDGPARPVGLVCKPYGRLSVHLDVADVFGGYWVFRTTSWETIRNLSSALKEFRQRFGFLAGLPLSLVMYQTTDQYEEKGESKSSKSWKVGLVVRGNLEAAHQLAASSYQLLVGIRKLLPAGNLESAAAHREQLARADEAEQAEIVAEFHPEAAAAAGDVTLNAEIVEERDPEEENRERLIRLVLAKRLTALQVNKKLAKYSGRLQELEQAIKGEFPDQYNDALDSLQAEQAMAAESDVEIIPSDEPGPAAPAPAPAAAPSTSDSDAPEQPELL